MIVISNTSPLTNLAAIGQFDLLRKLFGVVNIAEGVWQELNAYGKHWPGAVEVANAHWMMRHSVQNHTLVMVLRRDLDLGEAETIVMGLELVADLVLMDEKEGRHTAQGMNLRVIGTVGILLEAKTKNEITLIRPHLDALRQRAGFYLADNSYQLALRLAKE